MILCQINASAPHVQSKCLYETNSYARSSPAPVYEGHPCTITALIFNNPEIHDLEVF